jgi:hypothetical protein
MKVKKPPRLLFGFTVLSLVLYVPLFLMGSWFVSRDGIFGVFFILPLILIGIVGGRRKALGAAVAAALFNMLILIMLRTVIEGLPIDILGTAVLFLLGLALYLGVGLAVGKLADSNRELEKALMEVKALRGLIPICVKCKQIRDDQGSWRQIEEYFRKHMDAEFSHGLCPTCAGELYGERLGDPEGKTVDKK